MRNLTALRRKSLWPEVSILKIGLLNLNLKTKWKKIALDKYIRIWIKINSIRLWYRTSIHSSFQAYCTGWEWILNFKSLLTMRMNTEFFCGPLFIEVTFFGEISNYFLLCLPILVACSMMHIMYITVRKHPQFLFFCCCSRNTTVGFREFISNGSSDAWRVTMESDPLLGAASWGALCFKVDFIAWMYIRLPFQRFPRYKLTM